MRSRGSAIALVLTAAVAALLSACTRTPPVADGMKWEAVETPGFERLPQVTGQGAAALNLLFGQLDANARAMRADCLSAENENAEYARDVSAPFTGPRFLTVTVHESYYCGGVHPDVDLRRMTFDRRTGGLPDWPSLWPGAGVTASTNGYGNLPAVSRAPALIAWFRAAVRADSASDPAWLARCEAHYGAEPIEEGLVLWLDAKTGGVGMDLAWLAHAEKACGSPQVMPISVVEELGGSRELIDALRRGRAEQAYRETSTQ